MKSLVLYKRCCKSLILFVSIFLLTNATSISYAAEAKKKVAEPSIDLSPDDGMAKSPNKKVTYLPRQELFEPLIADYKEPRFSLGIIFTHVPNENFTAGLVSFGERFSIFRYSPFRENEGFQLGVDGGISSIFDFQSSSINLINADYFGGLPISFRHGAWSFRLRPYHQSSHLGDEFVLTTPALTRVNLSYESLDMMASYDWRDFRFYGGGEFIMRREPSTFDRGVLHAGAEWARDIPLFWKAFPFVAVDMKSYQENDFFPNTSSRGGFYFHQGEHHSDCERSFAVYAEAYYGFSPHGQFYTDRVLEAGMGLSFDF